MHYDVPLYASCYFFIGGEITVSWISSSSGDKPKLMTYVTLGLAGQLA
jgi:hypothetical protein